MLNFKFISAQFKNVWLIILAFGLVFALFIGLGAIFPAFGDMGKFVNHDNAPTYSGANMILNQTIFGYESLILFMVFGISISSNLINKDISKGYIASWLTTPMSRTTIFNSKLFVLISSTLLFNVWIIFLEIIIYSWRMADFNLVVGPLLLGNLGIMLFSLMSVSIPWIIFTIFRKNGVAIGINMGIIGWFAICYSLVQLKGVSGFENMKYFQYFTLSSLFNSPLQFDFLPSDWANDPNPHTTIGQIHSLKVLDYVWQFPLMLGIGAGCFTGAQFIIRNKDFAF